ncbi:twin-arginine translocase subunit TatC, partial [Planctomycetota bacterium]
MEGEPQELETMTLGEHLEELRKCVFWGLLALLATTLLCWLFYEQFIVDFMKAPLDMIAGRYENPFTFHNPLLDAIRGRLNPDLLDLNTLKVLSLFEPIVVKMKVSLLAGAILSSPIVIGQIWKFVKSGLYPREQKYVTGYGIASLVLFLVGCSFSFFFLLPIAAAVMLGG